MLSNHLMGEKLLCPAHIAPSAVSMRLASAFGSVPLNPQAEACDLMGGFVLLQSMAGGTGAGFGTYVAQALRDEYHSAHIVNACVWCARVRPITLSPLAPLTLAVGIHVVKLSLSLSLSLSQ